MAQQDDDMQNRRQRQLRKLKTTYGSKNAGLDWKQTAANTKTETEGVQRLFKLNQSFEAVDTLLRENVHSAQQVYRIGDDLPIADQSVAVDQGAIWQFDDLVLRPRRRRAPQHLTGFDVERHQSVDQ